MDLFYYILNLCEEFLEEIYPQLKSDFFENGV